MKKLLVVFTLAGLVVACNSNKKSSSASAGDYIGAPASSKTSDMNNVNRVNESAEVTAPKTHLDSVLLHSGSESQRSSYRSNSTYHNGVSGVGTGSSYAGYGYAQHRFKKKPKKTIEKPENQVEQELTDNIIPDSTRIDNNIIDSTNTVKKDSTSVDQGW